MATIKDIAAKANVSAMTVSRVIKNSGPVSPKTRKRIEAVINEMDYRPNALAQSLVLNRTNSILIVIPDIGNFFFSEMLQGTSEVMRKHDINILISSSFGNVDEEKRLLDLAQSKIVDGAILYVPRTDSNHLNRVGQSIPLVVIDRHFRSDSVAQVYLDNKKGARNAVEYLISEGHRKIGLIEGPENVQANMQRKSGYLEALKSNGISIVKEFIFEGDFSFNEGREAFTYFNKMKNGPTGYFATNDVMALGFIQQAQECNVSIPDRYSIIGFDDIQLSKLIAPQLTTVNHPKYIMGKIAAYEILKKLKITTEDGPKSELMNELVIRNSVKRNEG